MSTIVICFLSLFKCSYFLFSIHEAIVKEQLELLLFAFKNVADVVIAVNYFPTGSLLWAGKLDTKQIGLCGIISSFLHIFMLVKNIKKNERHALK